MNELALITVAAISSAIGLLISTINFAPNFSTYIDLRKRKEKDNQTIVFRNWSIIGFLSVITFVVGIIIGGSFIDERIFITLGTLVAVGIIMLDGTKVKKIENQLKRNKVSLVIFFATFSIYLTCLIILFLIK